MMKPVELSLLSIKQARVCLERIRQVLNRDGNEGTIHRQLLWHVALVHYSNSLFWSFITCGRQVTNGRTKIGHLPCPLKR